MTINLTKYDKETLFKEFEEFIKQKYESQNEISIPVSVFSQKLSPFETVVKYLVENLNLKYSEAGRLLKKERQVIWITYKRAFKKNPGKFDDVSGLNIPISYLSSEKLSISELIVGYLKDNSHMKNNEIAHLLKRDFRTIWTLYKRFLNKNA